MLFTPEHAKIIVSDLNIVNILKENDTYKLESVYGTRRLEAYNMLLEYSKTDDGEG